MTEEAKKKNEFAKQWSDQLAEIQRLHSIGHKMGLLRKRLTIVADDSKVY